MDIAENFCLSFFITEKSMDLSKIAISDDIYLENWVRYLKPIFFRGDMYDRWISQNTWVEISEEQKIENLRFTKSDRRRKIYFSVFWKLLDRICKSIFLPRTLKAYEKKGRPSGVVITNDMLKFHDMDKRKEISDRVY